jgi:hypothetical protein
VDVAAFIEKEEEAEERFQAGINKYKLGFRQGSTLNKHKLGFSQG